MTRICVTLASLHLLSLAVSTYIAAIEIETIIVSGVICSLTGLTTALFALMNRRLILSLMASLAPVLAVTLFLLEAFYWNWGPRVAAFPFMIIFLINQAFTTVVLLVQLRLLVRHPNASQSQITLRTLMMSTATFAVIFALTRFLIEQHNHNWLMAYALGFLGLTIGGLAMVLVSAWRTRRQEAVPVPAVSGHSVDFQDS